MNILEFEQKLINEGKLRYITSQEEWDEFTGKGKTENAEDDDE